MNNLIEKTNEFSIICYDGTVIPITIEQKNSIVENINKIKFINLNEILINVNEISKIVKSEEYFKQHPQKEIKKDNLRIL